MLGLSPMGHAFSWRDEPVRVLILNRADLSVAAESSVGDMSMFHFVDAWEARRAAIVE